MISHKEEEEMIISSHKKGSEEDYIKKEDTKVKGIRKMSDEEYDREVAEIKVHLYLFKEMLQQNIEDQYCVHVLKPKKFK